VVANIRYLHKMIVASFAASIIPPPRHFMWSSLLCVAKIRHVPAKRMHSSHSRRSSVLVEYCPVKDVLEISINGGIVTNNVVDGFPAVNDHKQKA